MDFLFDNPLTNMSGPLFLIIYGLIMLFSVIFLILFKSNLDWTSKLPAPLIPTNPDPFEIAYLRGGENEFARALVFALTQKGFLNITTEGKESYICLAQNQPNWTTLSQIERNALVWFQTKRKTSEVFEPYGIKEIIKPFSLIFEQNAIQNNLLTPEDVKTKTKRFSYLIFGAIALLGGYKLIAAIIHGHFNLLFLVGFTVIGFLIFRYLGKTKRLSQLGKQYVESLQNAFERLRENPKIAKEYYSQSMPVLNSVDPLLLAMGIYGTGVLVGNGYSDFETAFGKANKNNQDSSYSGCSSGCGVSCDSGSSSCSSGSSCSGGSSCGGGCGGGCGGS